MSVDLLIDTDIASYFVKGRHPSVDARFRNVDPERIAISAVTQAELLYGLKRLPPEHLLHLAVHRFLRQIRILPWDSAAAEAHADLRHSLTSNATPIGEMDLMIAAHAASVRATLVTNNTRHVGRLSSVLTVESWVEDVGR